MSHLSFALMKDLALFAAFLLTTSLVAWAFSRPLSLLMEGGGLSRFWNALERFDNACCRLCGIEAEREMGWKEYTSTLLVFNFAGILCLAFLLKLQGHFPLNPLHYGGLPWLLSLNIAVSFVTNTNWQAYSGEQTLSYFSQMAGLAVWNFISASTGFCVAVALMRGLLRKQASTLGNFWADLVRCTFWVLLPLSIILSLVYIQQGVPQDFLAPLTIHTLEGGIQPIATGPVASQEAIKLLGTNGGGFFNVNSAHPFENPTPLTNFIQLFSIFFLPMSLIFAFGRLCGDERQGRALFGAMLFLFLVGLAILYASESFGHPTLRHWGVAGPTSMEGKEVRFGIGGSSLFAAVTTAASCGAVNAMHDSLTPLGGLVPMLQMVTGEVIFGGVGSGFYGMIVFVVFTVFIVGLMVGRTPEYLGKKIEAFDIQMTVLAMLLPAVAILVLSALATLLPQAATAVANRGPHGLSEIFYAFASSGQNNGSAFAGLSVDRPFYNVATLLAMLVGRYGTIVPLLALAGNLATKRPTPPSAGTFPTTGPLFVFLLVVIIFIVGALTYLPILCLGPIVEQLLMLQGVAF